MISIFKESLCLFYREQIRDDQEWIQVDKLGSYCGQSGDIVAWVSGSESQAN